jgi:5-methylcytosine-specific restriction endonuclease McrA
MTTRERFYTTRAWRRLSRAFLTSKSYVCERCGRPADVAHHKARLTAANALDPEISLNPANLEALCIDCHNVEHFGKGGAVARGLRFTPNGDITEE